MPACDSSAAIRNGPPSGRAGFNVGVLLAVTGITVLFGGCSPSDQQTTLTSPATDAGTITLYCGRGVRKPVTECLRAFQQQTGIKVVSVFGSSPRMFAEVCRRHGDIYLAGDIHFIQLAQNQGDVVARQTVCYVVPVIVVPRGNPKRILRISDLGRPGVRFYLVDPKQCQQGFLGERLLAEHGLDAAAMRANRVSELSAGRDVPSMLAADELDAAILWQRGARTIGPEADIIESAELARAACPVAAVILRWCNNRAAAERLLEYLAGPAAQDVFRQHGFSLESPPISSSE